MRAARIEAEQSEAANERVQTQLVVPLRDMRQRNHLVEVIQAEMIKWRSREDG